MALASSCPRALVSTREVVQMIESATPIPTIAVTDLDRAKKFYGEILGFTVQDDRSDGVTYKAGPTWFLVYPSQFAGTNKATYMTFEVKDVEATAKELRDRGIVFEEYDMPGLKTVDGIAEIQGVKGAWFKDPDGNILAIGELT
jgi:catechol 2,3-dioxygenase-like lactoylglutathione lyase family enzyme